jgi:predicted DCC family thiol-disulfide oxidoreductase YuxK
MVNPTGDVARGTPHVINMNQVTVWYDGSCPICRREIEFMRRLDKRGSIRFVDATTAELSACPVDRREILARFHVDEDGRLLSGAAAFAAMWRAIPLLRPLGLAARSPVVLRWLEIVYLGFLKVRPSLQRAVRRVS